MISRRKGLLSIEIFVVLLTLVLAGGCAQKQWQQPVLENKEKTIRQLLDTEFHRQENCTCCIDSELTATWTSQISNGSLQGYLQIFMPSSLKIVGINPLGQPLFAFASNGKRFQSINAQKGVFKYGRLSTFMEKHNLPQHLMDGDWTVWLTGRLPSGQNFIKEIREDEQKRGVWLKVINDADSNKPIEYLLWNPLRKKLLERVIHEKDGDRFATISYHTWQETDSCPVPTTLEIDGGTFSANISVTLEDIVTDQVFAEDTFYLKLPPGYIQQFYP